MTHTTILHCILQNDVPLLIKAVKVAHEKPPIIYPDKHSTKQKLLHLIHMSWGVWLGHIQPSRVGYRCLHLASGFHELMIWQSSQYSLLLNLTHATPNSYALSDRKVKSLQISLGKMQTYKPADQQSIQVHIEQLIKDKHQRICNICSFAYYSGLDCFFL